jgi:pimeloyl-ACP methyl ester carboxylesterase
MRLVLLPFLLATSVMAPIPAICAPVPAAIDTDPPRDAAHPAAMSAFVIPVPEGALNAVMYTAAGTGPHPTLLLFHGFPGNEQNLDLAQAARRAGWNVLTLHYRGSWGSPGSFSFAHCEEDGAHALAFVRQRDTIIKFRIDPRALPWAGTAWAASWPRAWRRTTRRCWAPS